MKVFQELYLNGKICQSMNSTFITLIPNKDKSNRVSDYCPVNLVTSAYKIITKILLLRLNEVLDDTIHQIKVLLLEEEKLWTLPL